MGDIVFIYFNVSSVHVYFVLPPRHISKYITVLINKFLFKVSLWSNLVLFFILVIEDTPGTDSRMPQWDGKLAVFGNSLQIFFSNSAAANVIHMSGFLKH